MTSRFVTVVFVLLMVPVACLGAKGARLRGSVYAADEIVSGVVLKARVTVRGPGGPYAAESGADGSFDVQLPQGRFILIVESDGFCPFTSSEFAIVGDDTIELNPVLYPCAIASTFTRGSGGEVGPEQCVIVDPLSRESVDVESATGARMPALFRYYARRKRGERVVYYGINQARRARVRASANIGQLLIYADVIEFDRRRRVLRAYGHVLVSVPGEIREFNELEVPVRPVIPALPRQWGERQPDSMSN